jgi:hypothetical protein
MTLKYRLRLQNGRVIGPFTTEEIGELYLKNHVNGDEDCQHFPIGDCKKLDSFDNLTSFIKDVKNQTTAKTENSKEKTGSISTHLTNSGHKSIR